VSAPFIGEIRIFGFNFPPKGWAFCNGQVMSIAQNQALFAILGTTYGGNGTTSFNLPNLQGAAPVGVGTGFGQSIALGQTGGESAHTLTTGEMASHSHGLWAAVAPGDNNRSPSGNYLGTATGLSWYAGQPSGVTLNPATVGLTGGTQPHDNTQPYQVLNYCIALVGVFPSRN
jgi:microcystin-dependent protein